MMVEEPEAVWVTSVNYGTSERTSGISYGGGQI